jgi:WD repeat-containing protein 59
MLEFLGLSESKKIQQIGQETMLRPPLVNKESSITYRDPPKGMELPPLLPAPIGHRNSITEDYMMLPLNPVLQPHRGSAARALHEKGIGDGKPESGMGKPLPAYHTVTRPWLHGRINAGWKVAPMEPLAWLASVKVGDKRDGSSGAASRTDSRTGSQSRLSSRSSRSCERDNRRPPSSFRRDSQSRSRVKEERYEEEGSQTLQEE